MWLTKCYLQFPRFPRVCIYIRVSCIYMHKSTLKQNKLWGCKLYIFYIERDGSVEWKCLFTKPSVDLNPRNDGRRFRRYHRIIICLEKFVDQLLYSRFGLMKLIDHLYFINRLLILLTIVVLSASVIHSWRFRSLVYQSSILELLWILRVTYYNLYCRGRSKKRLHSFIYTYCLLYIVGSLMKFFYS